MRRIVVVDDDETILSLMQAALEHGGFAVKTCTNSSSLQLALSDLPDAIFLDIRLKDDDGRDICRPLKSQEETRHIPIILCSAHIRAQEGLEQTLADDFLEKPFHLADLLAKAKQYSSVKYDIIPEKKPYIHELS